MKWSGDVDLNDGELQRMYATYMNRLKFVSRIGLDDRVSLLQDISTCIGEISSLYLLVRIYNDSRC